MGPLDDNLKSTLPMNLGEFDEFETVQVFRYGTL